jgi:BMFP domain-containing protein YqiC
MEQINLDPIERVAFDHPEQTLSNQRDEIAGLKVKINQLEEKLNKMGNIYVFY